MSKFHFVDSLFRERTLRFPIVFQQDGMWYPAKRLSSGNVPSELLMMQLTMSTWRITRWVWLVILGPSPPVQRRNEVINCNPETVSTDYDESDRLYFEDLQSWSCQCNSKTVERSAFADFGYVNKDLLEEIHLILPDLTRLILSILQRGANQTVFCALLPKTAVLWGINAGNRNGNLQLWATCRWPWIVFGCCPYCQHRIWCY